MVSSAMPRIRRTCHVIVDLLPPCCYCCLCCCCCALTLLECIPTCVRLSICTYLFLFKTRREYIPASCTTRLIIRTRVISYQVYNTKCTRTSINTSTSTPNFQVILCSYCIPGTSVPVQVKQTTVTCRDCRIFSGGNTVEIPCFRAFTAFHLPPSASSRIVL